MTRLARRLLALVSIAGGGLVGAAPSALAAPEPPPSTATSGVAVVPDVTHSPGPSPTPATVPVDSGRAPLAGGLPSVRVSAPDLPTVSVRTGRAADVTPAAPSGPSAVPTPDASAPAGPPASSTTPSAPSSPTLPRPDPRPGGAVTPAGAAGAARSSAPGGATPVAAAPPPATASTYTVVTGDSLWTIAAAHLAAATAEPGAVMTDDAVAPYWRAVCDANQATLRSGDLNVIYPGEQVALPPVG